MIDIFVMEIILMINLNYFYETYDRTQHRPEYKKILSKNDRLEIARSLELLIYHKKND